MFFPLNGTDNIKIVQVNTGLYNHVIAKNKYMYLKDEICTRCRNVTHSLETRQVHHCHSGVLILQSYIQPWWKRNKEKLARGWTIWLLVKRWCPQSLFPIRCCDIGMFQDRFSSNGVVKHIPKGFCRQNHCPIGVPSLGLDWIYIEYSLSLYSVYLLASFWKNLVHSVPVMHSYIFALRAFLSDRNIRREIAWPCSYFHLSFPKCILIESWEYSRLRTC